MADNVAKARRLLYELIPLLGGDPEPGRCSCCKALEYAIV